MEILLDIGAGLKIAKVNVEELREQDLNARHMDKKMFERLSANIRHDARLESLPFVAQTERGLEIVSGHHRVRAARSADLNEIFIILDDTGLSQDEIRSKQLSHNSLQGEDNMQLVKEIYAMIEDADQKLSAYIDADLELMFDKAQVKDVTIDFDIKHILVTFLTYEKAVFDRAAEKINGKYDELYVADMKQIEPFTQAMTRAGKEYDIRATSTLFSKMAEIVLQHLGEEIDEAERTAIRDIIGTAYIPTEAAQTIQAAIDKMKKNGEITNANKWQALEYMAADYLGGR